MCWGKKLTVVWNSERDRLETTAKSIRPFPEALRGKVKLYVAMCDPYKGTCKRERCTFAHGKAEQKAWNQILREKGEFITLAFCLRNCCLFCSNYPWPITV